MANKDQNVSTNKHRNNIDLSSIDESYYIQHKLNEEKTKKNPINLDSFHLISIIGKGAYAKVALVRKKDDGKIYALKILKKSLIEKKDQQQRVWEERKVLEETCNQFVVKMKYAFQDSKKLFFVLEYCPGGELFQILSQKESFSEQHLKPENILIDQQGYVKLTDFGLSKRNITGRKEAKSMCGTPEYLAPEILFQQGHGKEVDFWTLGCIIYEMFTGWPPFQVESSAKREVLFQKIKFEMIQMPSEIKGDLKDLLEKLLEKNPEQRLGFQNGADDIIAHPWFKDFEWKKLLDRKIEPPFVPNLSHDTEVKYFDQEFVEIPIQSPENDHSSYSSKIDNQAYSKFSYWDNLSRKASPTNYQLKENISPSNSISSYSQINVNLNENTDRNQNQKEKNKQNEIIFLDSEQSLEE